MTGRARDVDSDIDVLVVRRAPVEQTGELAAAIRRWSGNDAHVVDVTTADLARMVAAGEPILDSWRAELVPLVGQFRVPRTARSREANGRRGD